MQPAREVDIDAAKKHLDEGTATFVDIRDPMSYEAAKIPGAVALGNDSADAFVADTDKTKPVIVYCYHGNNSRMGAAWLTEQGFDAFSMSGGFEAWRLRFESEPGGTP